MCTHVELKRLGLALYRLICTLSEAKMCACDLGVLKEIARAQLSYPPSHASPLLLTGWVKMVCSIVDREYKPLGIPRIRGS